jgi:hypothetical protein
VAGKVIKLIPTGKRANCVNGHQRVNSRRRGSEDERKLAAGEDPLPVGAGTLLIGVLDASQAETEKSKAFEDRPANIFALSGWHAYGQRFALRAGRFRFASRVVNSRSGGCWFESRRHR